MSKLNLPGYTIFRESGHDLKHVTYRGVREKDHTPIIIKALVSTHPALNDVARLKNEYDLLKDLHLPTVVQAYSLEEQQNQYFLILEDTSLPTLEKYISSKALTINEKLQLAINTTKALADLQSQDIIHKNLQPENILVDPDTLSVKITGFNFATKIPKQRMSFKNPSMLEGSLAFMSPEQTGRMNREVDYRSDFYSLGIILYKLFTNELPFKTIDPMELVHSHIAKIPLPAYQIDKAIPEQISAIIAKLLSKRAEDRYSSAYSLLSDLERCQEELKADGKISLFPLGLNDISQKLQISQKVYGREKEIQSLLRSFDEVCSGSSQMILLGGYPGIGKTSIVHEIHKPLLEKKAFYIAGKYDQYKANIPYSAFIEAFQDLIQQILTENEDTIAAWREKLKSALGVNSQVIMEVIPELQYILGERPIIQEFDSQETQNRFNFFFQRFISLYASPETPLVVFLDDLQWVDSASLQLIEIMLTTLKTKGLLLIGAYRNNETSPLHPLITMTQRIAKNGANIKEIEVPPLTIHSVNQLIADSLHLSIEKCRPLCEIIYNKTRGNPFFTNQLLTFLYEEGLLYVDSKGGTWDWNLDKIRSLDVSDNVIDLLIAKLNKCSQEMQKILQTAACIGSHFDIQLLSMIMDMPIAKVMQNLVAAIKEGFILPSEDIYKYLWLDSSLLVEEIQTESPSKRFKFLHDKVQQAAYLLMSESQRKSTHYSIGRYLLKKFHHKQFEEHVFEIMAQLNHADDLITEAKERKQYAQMNLIAAQKAMRTVAYGTALEFLKKGKTFLTEDAWEKEYTLTFQLHLLWAETTYLLFNFDEASRIFDQILEYAKTTHDKILVHTLKIKLYISSANYKEAIRWARQGLKLLGVSLPTKYLKLHIIKEFIALKFRLLGKDTDSMMALPVIKDTTQYDIIHILVLSITPSYLTSKDLFAFVVLKGLNLTLKYGNAPMTSYIYASYGIILTAIFEDFKSSYGFGKLALDLNQKFDDQKYVPATKFIVGTFLNPTRNHLRTSIPILQTGFEMGTSIGDFINAVFCQGMLFTDKYLAGFNIDELAIENISCLDYVAKIKSHNRGYIFNALKQIFMALNGKTYNPTTLQSEDFSEEAFFQMLRDNNFVITLYFNLTFKMQLCYLFENYETAIEVANKAEELTYCVIGQPMRLENDFYHALALAANYSWKDRSTQKMYMKKIRSILVRLKHWSDAVPQNYLHKYLLISAEVARIEGNKELAVEMYDKAISSAKENSYVQNEGIANELFAKFYLSQNRAHIAKQYLIDSHYAFYLWGAKAKTAQLEQKYASTLPNLGGPTTEITTEGKVTSQASSLDLMAVIRATQEISGQIVIDKLLDQLMSIVIETAGAEKAVLILEKEGIWIDEAEFISSGGGRTFRPSTPYQEKGDTLPIAILNYVLRTKEHVTLDDARNPSIFSSDPYISSQKPQSILCFPLISQGKLVGLLYLENNLTTRAFTPSRIEVLKLLTTQIATALENALLYSNQESLTTELKASNEKLEDERHNLEKRVYDRTRELNEKNKQLEETFQQIKEMQKKLIEQEKLVSMGAVTKSIANELRTPLNYVYNFATLSKELLVDLQQSSDSISQQSIEQIAMNLDKINEHSKKADEIITSISLQSRTTENLKEPTDINRLIRDYADLVYYSYYKQDPLFSLTIETDYDPTIEKINISPKNLGRVFYSVIDNACYATDLKKKQKGGSYSPIVSISTKNEEDQIVITIRDNGVGIPKDILARVFEPFLTTKPSGKGAGMGLSISHDIIVEDHGGEISIKSEEGEYTEVTIILLKKPVTLSI